MLNEKKQSWSGRFGFLMAAVGSAVGLGNIWRFPYVTGQNGGAIFLIAYFIMIILIGFSMMLAEFAVGRHAGKNVVSAFQVKNKKWGFVGVLSCIVSFLIVSYYSVIGGWIIRYAFGYVAGGGFVSSGNFAGAFAGFMQTGWLPILFLILFMSICLVVILLGVKKGIESVNKVLMPLLFVMLIFVMIVSLTMEGSLEGVKFFIIPDFSSFENVGAVIFGAFLAALGQAFYSLSVGLGIGTTYGSYAGKNMNLTKNTLLVCVSDSMVALISGFAILPAVFAAGQEPTQGAGLVFVTLPAVFQKLGSPFGQIVAVVFFMLVLFAAVTSAIALIEVNVAVFSERFKMKRKTATFLIVFAATAVGILVSLSQGGFFGSLDLLYVFDTFSNTFMLPVIAICTSIYVGYIWKPKNAVLEITNQGEHAFKLEKIWSFNLRYLCPVLIAVLLVFGIVSLFL